MINAFLTELDSRFKASKVLAVICVTLGIYLLGQSFYYQGLYTGFNLAEANAQGTCYPVVGSFCLSDANPYAEIIGFHTYINWLLLIYILSRIVKVSVLTSVTSALSLVLLLFLLSRVSQLKTLASGDTDPYFDLIRTTFAIETVWIGLVAILVVFEIVSFLIYGFKKFK
jgi:hypothetical protein